MTQYRVGSKGAVLLKQDGSPVLKLPPGSVIEGDLAEVVEPKMRRERSDKARRAVRDYEDKSS